MGSTCTKGSRIDTSDLVDMDSAPRSSTIELKKNASVADDAEKETMTKEAVVSTTAVIKGGRESQDTGYVSHVKRSTEMLPDKCIRFVQEESSESEHRTPPPRTRKKKSKLRRKDTPSYHHYQSAVSNSSGQYGAYKGRFENQPLTEETESVVSLGDSAKSHAESMTCRAELQSTSDDQSFSVAKEFRTSPKYTKTPIGHSFHSSGECSHTAPPRLVRSFENISNVNDATEATATKEEMLDEKKNVNGFADDGDADDESEASQHDALHSGTDIKKDNHEAIESDVNSDTERRSSDRSSSIYMKTNKQRKEEDVHTVQLLADLQGYPADGVNKSDEEIDNSQTEQLVQALTITMDSIKDECIVEG